MKKKFLLSLSGFMIGMIALMNVSIAKTDAKINSNLFSIGKVASAECEAPSAQNCPGGSCSYVDSFGDCCTACCPEGKDPTCNSTGCHCY